MTPQASPVVTPASWQPADSAARYRSIDILRGLALFGVLMVNLLMGFRLPLLECILRPFADRDWANHLVDLLASGVLEFKALTIFSFLFGVGIAIQADRADRRNVNTRIFLTRRMAWLFVLGLAHLLLIWNGDILTLYAVCGLLLVPFIGLPWPALLAIGAAAIALPEVVPWGIGFPSGPVAKDLIAQARQIYGHGSFAAIMEFRWHECRLLIMPLLIAVLPRTVGLMYLGVAAWRSGILREPERHRGKLLIALALGAIAGGAVTANEVWGKSSGRVPWPALRAADFAASILLAAAYVSGLLLWLKTPRTSRLPGIASLGQMALTNYLLQSVVLGLVFYGYGFGLFGRLGSASAACIGIALYAAQVQCSRMWLRRFRFGPFEWLWRSLTYGQRQPFSVRYDELLEGHHGATNAGNPIRRHSLQPAHRARRKSGDRAED